MLPKQKLSQDKTSSAKEQETELTRAETLHSPAYPFNWPCRCVDLQGLQWPPTGRWGRNATAIKCTSRGYYCDFLRQVWLLKKKQKKNKIFFLNMHANVNVFNFKIIRILENRGMWMLCTTPLLLLPVRQGNRLIHCLLILFSLSIKSLSMR